MSRRLRVSRQAERDVDGIFRWIADRSPTGAVRWYDKYLSVVRELPKGTDYPAVAEADDLGLDLRERLFKTRRGHVYRIVFLIREQFVDVLAVRGAGQDFLSAEELDLPE